MLRVQLISGNLAGTPPIWTPDQGSDQFFGFVNPLVDRTPNQDPISEHWWYGLPLGYRHGGVDAHGPGPWELKFVTTPDPVGPVPEKVVTWRRHASIQDALNFVAPSSDLTISSPQIYWGTYEISLLQGASGGPTTVIGRIGILEGSDREVWAMIGNQLPELAAPQRYVIRVQSRQPTLVEIQTWLDGLQGPPSQGLSYFSAVH